jgi:hypothetical protein
VLGLVAAFQSHCRVWGGLARSGGIWGRWYLVWYWFCRACRQTEIHYAIRITDDTMTVHTVDRIAAGFRQHTAASGHVSASATVSCLAGNRPGYRKAADSGIAVAGVRPAVACLRG